MALNVEMLPESSHGRVEEIFATAYKADPSVLSMGSEFFSDEQLKQGLKLYFRQLVKLGAKYGQLCGVYCEGRLAGAAIYYGPGQFPIPSWAAVQAFAQIAWPLGRSLGFRKLWHLANTASMLEKQHPSCEHFYPEIGCVDPRYQGRGVAAAMLNHVVERGRLRGLGTYLETSNPRNVKLWARFGFEVLKRTDIGGVTYYSMWKECGADSRSTRNPLARSEATLV